MVTHTCDPSIREMKTGWSRPCLKIYTTHTHTTLGSWQDGSVGRASAKPNDLNLILGTHMAERQPSCPLTSTHAHKYPHWYIKLTLKCNTFLGIDFGDRQDDNTYNPSTHDHRQGTWGKLKPVRPIQRVLGQSGLHTEVLSQISKEKKNWPSCISLPSVLIFIHCYYSLAEIIIVGFSDCFICQPWSQ